MDTVTGYVVYDYGDCEFEYQRLFRCAYEDLPRHVAQDHHFREILTFILKDDDNCENVTEDKLLEAAKIGLDQKTNRLRYFKLTDLLDGRYVNLRFSGYK